MPSPPSTLDRTCTACGRLKPLTRAYFVAMRGKTGFTAECLDCLQVLVHSDIEDEGTVHRAKAIVNRLDEQSIMLLDQLAEHKHDLPSDTLPHLGTMLEDILALFGGSRGYANHFMAQYLSSKPGGMNRNSQLKTIVKLTEKVTETGITRPPVSQMSDAELTEHLQKTRDRLNASVPAIEGEAATSNGNGEA